MQWSRGWRYFLVSGVLVAIATSSPGAKADPPNPAGACPTDLEILVNQLLADLPNYANRTNIQLGIPNNYVIIASRPEFQPLPLGPGQRAAALENPVVDAPDQVFVTTLERSYQGSKSVQLQLYHWLFLTRTDSGWRLALMYSMVGPYPGGYPPSPPQESSNGSLAQAIRTWLRDCRSNSLPPV